MKVLAIDTSEAACSVALLLDDDIIERYQFAPQKHTQFILPFIQELLSKAGLSLPQLDVLAFGKGPGSFTGLRIAAGITQGLAYALDLPVVPISTLRALAQSAYRQFESQYVFPALDARMNQVYFGAYQLDDMHFMQSIISDIVVDPNQMFHFVPYDIDFIGTGIGSGWDVYSETLQQNLITQFQNNRGNIKFYVEQFVHAQDIAKLAAYEFQQGNIVTAEEALPIYLRDF